MRANIFLAFALAMGSMQPAHAEAPKVTVRAPEGGAFRGLTPAVSQRGAEVTVTGGYCRTNSYTRRPTAVRIAAVDFSGNVKAERVVHIFGALGARSRGCGYYSMTANWTLASGDAIRVTSIQ